MIEKFTYIRPTIEIPQIDYESTWFKELQQSFSNLGLSLTDSSGNFKNVGTLFKDLKEVFNDIK